jgi:hypothetical protein
VPPGFTGGGGGGGGGGGPITVAVGGQVSNINATAQTFSLTLATWTGGWQLPNVVLSVVTMANTQYSNNGTSETASTFFTNLADSMVVQVRGTLQPDSTITAASVNVIPPNANPLGVKK